MSAADAGGCSIEWWTPDDAQQAVPGDALCGARVVAYLVTECGHQHLEVAAYCWQDRRLLKDGSLRCTPCRELGHRSVVRLVAELNEREYLRARRE